MEVWLESVYLEVPLEICNLLSLDKPLPKGLISVRVLRAHKVNFLFLVQILIIRSSVSVCDGCGHDYNKFAGRVQNHHVRLSLAY